MLVACWTAHSASPSSLQTVLPLGVCSPGTAMLPHFQALVGRIPLLGTTYIRLVLGGACRDIDVGDQASVPGADRPASMLSITLLSTIPRRSAALPSPFRAVEAEDKLAGRGVHAAPASPASPAGQSPLIGAAKRPVAMEATSLGAAAV